MWTRARSLVAGALFLGAIAATARADKFFDVSAVGSGGTLVDDDGGNIIHLTDNLISQNRGFAALAGQNVAASLSWGGLPNAILLTENAGQTQATLTFPTTGFTRTFTGANAADLQDQIRDFIKGDGAGAYAGFIRTMDQLSAVATLDGNPQASTASISEDVFTRFGTRNQQPTQYWTYPDGAYIGLEGEGGGTRADQLDGGWADVTIDSGVRFGSHVALSLGTTLSYRDVGSSSSYLVAEEIALPITLINADEYSTGLSWQVSPWAFAGLAASYDQASGGLLVGGGGTSSLALHLGLLKITLADQISYTGNTDVSVDGYGFDTRIDQWILKNGIEARLKLPHSPFFIDGGVTYSNFLRKAAVPNYWTPMAGVGIAFSRYSSLRVGYRGDFARQYSENGGELSLVVAY